MKFSGLFLWCQSSDCSKSGNISTSKCCECCQFSPVGVTSDGFHFNHSETKTQINKLGYFIQSHDHLLCLLLLWFKILCHNASAVSHCHRRNEYAGVNTAKFLQNGCANEGMVKMNKCTYMTSVCSNLNLCLLVYCILCLWVLWFCAVFMG